jgi:hypothetical protein
MKYLLIIITLFSFNSMAFSQDSISVRTEIDTFSPANYEGQYDYVFARKEPKTQLFKTGILGFQTGESFELFAYERKINQDMSIHLSMNIRGIGSSYKSSRLLNNSFGERDTSFRSSEGFVNIAIEPRWYFNMKKGIKSGLIANNFHGSYISLRTSYGLENDPYFIPDWKFNKDSSFATTSFNDMPKRNHFISNELCFGIQRRILRFQYIDFGIGTGIRTRIKTNFPTDEKRMQWIFNYRLSYGFVLDGFKKKKNNAARCEALHCFEEEKSMWKIGLSNLITRFNQKQFSGILSAAYEQKIPNTMFSLEGNVAVAGNAHARGYSFSKNDNRYAVRVGVMPRYYYELKEKIAQGKSANNLSGNYLGLKLDYDRAQKFDNLQSQSFDATLLWGSQQRILKHLFYEFWVGYDFLFEKTKLETSESHGMTLNFSLGLAF